MTLVARLFFFASLIIISTFAAHADAASSAGEKGVLTLQQFQKRPRLVVAIVIDQFRSDYLTRFPSRFLPATKTGGEVGGFQFLMEKGAYFPMAEYASLQNMTCPGHATIMSGSHPYHTRIAINEWYDAEKGQTVYCVGDESAPLVGPAGGGKEGISPRNFRGSTVGDELKNAGYPSRVIAVSLKDRAAVLMGGQRADLALWLGENFQWISSQYYLKSGLLPEWVNKLNASLTARKGQTYKWDVSEKPTGLSTGKNDEPLHVTKTIGTLDSLETPLGGELTTDAALAAIDAYSLGKGAATDLLLISYSSHDLLGHRTSPNSREMEEMTVSEDREFARLFNGIRKRLPGGLNDVVISLTADHGMAPNLNLMREAGLDAGNIDTLKMAEKIEAAMNEKYGAGKNKWLATIRSLNFFLDAKNLAERKVSRGEVESTMKAVIAKEPGVAHVFSRSDYEAGRLPSGTNELQIKNTYVVGRSGDLVAIPKPFFIEGTKHTHMTGYSYDRSVPLIIYGAKMRAGVYASQAQVVDLAPTLSFLLGVLPPAQSDGRVLSEAIGGR